MEINDEDYVIITKNLKKIYKHGNVLAVDGLNLKIRRGEIYALIGANGSGKTTTINILSGALYPTEGEVFVMGYEMPKYRKHVSKFIGVAPQEFALYPDLTVRENIAFFANLYNLSKTRFKERLEHLLDVLRLEDKKDVLVRRLSGGMKRRVSIACALVHSPKIGFFDEATVGVDPVLRTFFWGYFRKLCEEQDMTLIITSHVMDEAERADRIGLMREGKLIEEGTPRDLIKKHNVKNIEEIFLKLSDRRDENE